MSLTNVRVGLLLRAGFLAKTIGLSVVFSLTAWLYSCLRRCAGLFKVEGVASQHDLVVQCPDTPLQRHSFFMLPRYTFREIKQIENIYRNLAVVFTSWIKMFFSVGYYVWCIFSIHVSQVTLQHQINLQLHLWFTTFLTTECFQCPQLLNSLN